ncbi:MAG: hypothetical protein CL827_04245 [Crocinitomicaceae bacterium]|nr:hypothetical protein [Crocinitomicaceae bacterium]
MLRFSPSNEISLLATVSFPEIEIIFKILTVLESVSSLFTSTNTVISFFSSLEQHFDLQFFFLVYFNSCFIS